MAVLSPALDAIVLAGGRGTRLAAVLPDRQKVAADVGGMPFLLRLVRWLGQAGVTRVVLAAGHRAADIQALAADRGEEGPELVVTVEPEPLGTGGALRFAAQHTSSDPVLALNGDSFAGIDLATLVSFHRERGARVSLALVPVPAAGRYGVVETDARGAVSAFAEKPDAGPAGGWINAGVYVFQRSAFDLIPPDRPSSLEREVFPSLVGRGLFAKRFEARFIDIGTPDSLAAAAEFFAQERRAP
jgi:NDP-sugar pyrophosphorylase family protein